MTPRQARKRCAPFLAGAFFSALCQPPARADGCKLERVADIEEPTTGATPTVPVIVNGQPLKLLLDTGAESTVITTSAAKRIGLPTDPYHSSSISGIASEQEGAAHNPDVIVGSISIGSAHLPTPRLHTGFVLPPNRQDDIDGVLGHDLLGGFDIELAIPYGHVGLWTASGCYGRYMPWQSEYRVMHASEAVGESASYMIPSSLDGHPLEARLDTGATASMISSASISRLDLELPSPRANGAIMAAAYGPDGNEVQTLRVAITGMTIAGEKIPKSHYLLYYGTLPLNTDMIIGMPYIARHLLWLSVPIAQIAISTN